MQSALGGGNDDANEILPSPRGPNISIHNDETNPNDSITRIAKETQDKNNTSMTVSPDKTNLVPSTFIKPRNSFNQLPPPTGFKMPQKYLNEIKELQKAKEKSEILFNELNDKVNVNDRILSRINDYYESNLRAISVKNLGE